MFFLYEVVYHSTTPKTRAQLWGTNPEQVMTLNEEKKKAVVHIFILFSVIIETFKN